MTQSASIGRVVHYVARGSADGVFLPVCRPADVTEVNPNDPNHVGLMVKNPTGLFFHPIAAGGCLYMHPDNGPDGKPRGGTWHWHTDHN